MVFLLDRDDIFECRKSEQGEGAGVGVFCAQDVKAGTILPYYGITIKDEDEYEDEDAEDGQDEQGEENADDDDYRTYVVSADYTTNFGNQRTLKGYSMDGDPNLPEIQRLEDFKKLACRINEASKYCQPNCLLVSNPAISRDDIKRSFVQTTPIPVTFIVTVEDLPKGTELLTCYGDDYGRRRYTPCKIKRNVFRAMIDRAYNHVDQLASKRVVRQSK